MTKFKPRKGQVDFTHARFAPVVNCIVRQNSKILLVKRSEALNFYPGFWNGVSGFLDDEKGLEEKVKEELREELGIAADKVRTIRLGDIFHQEESKYKKTWIVHPVLVDVLTDKIMLDAEAQEYKWIDPSEAEKFDLLPGFDRVIANFFS